MPLHNIEQYNRIFQAFLLQLCAKKTDVVQVKTQKFRWHKETQNKITMLLGGEQSVWKFNFLLTKKEFPVTCSENSFKCANKTSWKWIYFLGLCAPKYNHFWMIRNQLKIINFPFFFPDVLATLCVFCLLWFISKIILTFLNLKTNSYLFVYGTNKK